VPARTARTTARRRQRPRSRRRLPRLTAPRLAAALLLLVGFLYYRPIMSYFETRAELGRRAAQVRELKRERQQLERGLPGRGEPALAIEARRLGLVKPGERLIIVEGVTKWRRAHARPSAR
jgi:hypothetical protein